MYLWILELYLGSALVFLAVRYFPKFLERCSPRLWRESTLPPQSSDEIDAISILVLFFIFLLAFIIPGIVSPSFTWGIFIFLFFVMVACLLWAFMMRQRWWKLEQGSSLRVYLDRISQNMGIPLGKVRLREGNAGIVKVYLDGSIEPTTGFFRDLPIEQQEFLLTVAIFQKKNRVTLKRLLLWSGILLGFPIVTAGSIMLQYRLHASDPFGVGRLVGICFGALCIWRCACPKLSDAALRFALEQTGDFEAAAEAVRRFDKKDADARLERLRVWWDAQSKNIPQIGTQPGAVASNVQTLTQNRH